MTCNKCFGVLSILTLGDAERDFREAANCLDCNEDQNEEEVLVRRAIALSEENEEENDDEELLRRAIAMSLEACK